MSRPLPGMRMLDADGHGYRILAVNPKVLVYADADWSRHPCKLGTPSYLPDGCEPDLDDRATVLLVADQVAARFPASSTPRDVTLDEAILEMTARMRAVGHRTAWMHGTHCGNVVFTLVTVHEDTAVKVHAALDREGLLCQMNLGKPGEAWISPNAEAP
jgi:hypothetical protein